MKYLYIIFAIFIISSPAHGQGGRFQGNSALEDSVGNTNSILSGNLDVTNTPLAWAIVKGLIPGTTFIDKFGHNSAVGATLEEVWDGSALYLPLLSDSTLYISSSDTNDDQDYEIQGLDANWVAKIDTVTANGFSFVAASGTWIRVFRIKNIGATNNAGNIYCSSINTDVGGDGIPDIPASIKAIITANFNQTLMAMWPTAAETTCYIDFMYGSTSSSKATEIHLYVRPFGGVYQIKKLLTIFQGTTSYVFKFPLEIPPKSDVKIMAITSGGGGEVSAGFSGWCEQE